MNEVIDKHLQSIEDYIFAEDKIVTYKWISIKLQVHVNTAKQLLHAFSIKDEFKEKLTVIYVIAGQTKNDTGLKFCLVEQKDLDEVKNSFSEILFYHVYSVQTNASVDSTTLYNADDGYEITEEDRKFCGIQKNDDIVKRSSNRTSSFTAEVSANKATSQPKENLINMPCKSSSEKNNDTSKKANLPESSSDEGKFHKETKPESVSPVKEHIKTSPKKGGPQKSKKLKNGSVVPKSSSSIGSFFNKQSSKAISKKTEPQVKILDEEKVEFKENVEQSSNKSNSEIVQNKKSITPPVKKKENQKKRKKRDKDDESSSKRRKRIKILSDSENSSDESEMEVEEEREPSPEPEPIKIQESDDEIIPPTPVEKGRRRIRKQVDRTFTDEDGFVITKKEFVYESCSDDETPSEKRKETKIESKQEEETLKNTKTEVTKNKSSLNKTKPAASNKKSPVKNKQKTLMNFFTKK